MQMFNLNSVFNFKLFLFQYYCFCGLWIFFVSDRKEIYFWNYEEAIYKKNGNLYIYIKRFIFKGCILSIYEIMFLGYVYLGLGDEMEENGLNLDEVGIQKMVFVEVG